MKIRKKQKFLVIVGPTSSGKSELAVKLAKKFNGEIISADSRQVYRGLNLGTGKVEGGWTHLAVIPAQAGIQVSSVVRIREPGFRIPPPPRLRRTSKSGMTYLYKSIPHYCIDFVSPKRQFSVTEFKQCAEEAIRDISSRGKVPILVGGTAFWINAVAYDLNFPEVPPNVTLRKKLELKKPAELLAMLTKLDPKRVAMIEQKNPRRLIRAIEIAKVLGKVPVIKKRHPYDALWIGISVIQETLKKKIKKRLTGRIHSGMLDEAKALQKKGISWKRFYQLGLEYTHLADYLRKKITRTEMEAHMLKANLDYVRRQMVWLRKNTEIQWIATTEEARKLTETFLQS